MKNNPMSEKDKGRQGIWRSLSAMAIALSVLLLGSCTSTDELITLSKCEFRVVDATDIVIAGIPIEESMDYSDLTYQQILALLAAAQAGYMPISLNVNVEVMNPNSSLAAMNKADWILYLDGFKVAEDTFDERVEIPPNGGIVDVAIPVSANLSELMEGESADALINLAMNLTDVSEDPSKITLRIKPYIMVGGTLIPYPGFFDVSTEFTSGDDDD